METTGNESSFKLEPKCEVNLNPFLNYYQWHRVSSDQWAVRTNQSIKIRSPEGFQEFKISVVEEKSKLKSVELDDSIELENESIEMKRRCCQTFVIQKSGVLIDTGQRPPPTRQNHPLSPSLPTFFFSSSCSPPPTLLPLHPPPLLSYFLFSADVRIYTCISIYYL